MAAKLEGDTTYYGAHILLSEAVRDSLNHDMQDEVRLIDRVDYSGGEPVRVYTLDLDDLTLDVDVEDAPQTKAAKIKARWERQKRKNERDSSDCPANANP